MKKLGFFILSFLLVTFFSSCTMFSDSDDTKTDWESKVTSISLDKTKLEVEGGCVEYITLNINPSDVRPYVSPKWIASDESLFSLDGSSSGCLVTGKREGQGYIKCILNQISVNCLVKVTSDDINIVSPEYYIYTGDNEGTVELNPGNYKTVSVNLFNGSQAMYEDFVWSVENPTVCSISGARNNCVISALKTGSTQVTVKHPKATYPFTFVVYVYSDISQGVPYIHTTQNVISINTNDTPTRTITFDIQNDTSNGGSKNAYTYEDTSITGKGSIVQITSSNSNTLQITGVKSGQAEITVSNSYCEYPLKIIVVVSTIVNNVYVTLSDSSLQISDDGYYTLYAYLNGYDGFVDNDDFTWEIEAIENSMSSYNGNIENYIDFTPSGNSCQISGKKNGVFKIKAGHKLSQGKRNAIIMLSNQKGSAIDSSMFITTSQNYIQTQVKAEESEVKITLVGGEKGDEQDFIWEVSSKDGDPMKMLSYTCVDSGTVKSRSALTSGTDAYGTLYITPNKEGLTGDVTITVSHPKCLYTTEILVRIFSEYALLSDPVYLNVKDDENNDVSVIKMLYSDEGIKLNAELDGSDDTPNILWQTTDDTKITVNPEKGEYSYIMPNSSQTEAGSSYINVSHKDAISAKRILCLTAATQEDLDSLKGVYAEETYFRLSEDTSSSSHTAKIKLMQYGLTNSDIPFIKFVSNDSSICFVVMDEITDLNTQPIQATIYGNSSGKTTIEAYYDDGSVSSAHVIFDIVVLPEGEATGVIEASYLTTNLNSTVLAKADDTEELSVIGVNISASDMLKTQWNFSNGFADDVVSITSNGCAATITALKEGKTQLTVTNPLSVNSITINVKVGALYEYEDGFYCYISTQEDTFQVVKGDTITIGAALENCSSSSNRWAWTTDSDIIKLTPVQGAGVNSVCYIDALEAGMAYVTISNASSVAEKEILIVVGNTKEELKGLSYLTTTQNVVTVGEQNNISVSVSIENATSNVITGYSWQSSNPDIVDVVSSGATAVFYGKKQGTAVVTVTNDDYCNHPLEIIANCVDPVVAASNPYISCTNILTITEGEDATQINAELIGGTEQDNVNFAWSTASTGIIQLYSSNETCSIKGLQKGIAQVVVSHPKASGISRTILVIVNEKSLVEYTITSSDSLIQTLSPTDSIKTLSVELENGSESDKNNFKWWASSYDEVVSIRATENYCSVTPIAPGNVEIYVSHPKAKYSKTFNITVSKFTDFKINGDNYLIMTKGGNAQITTENPVTSADTEYVVFASNNENVIKPGISRTDSKSHTAVCNLIATGTGNCIITATLHGYKNGIDYVYGTADLMCYVEEGDGQTLPYIKLTTGSPIVTTNVNEQFTLITQVFKDGVQQASDSNAFNFTWTPQNSLEVSPKIGNVRKFTALDGSEGVSIINITHPDCTQALSVYVVIQGSGERSISLPEKIQLIEGGEDKLIANINNPDPGDYGNIIWESENQNIATYSGTGKTVTVKGIKEGFTTIKATLKDNPELYAVCEVEVIKKPEIIFDYKQITVSPNSQVKIPYKIIPESDSIKFPVNSSNIYSARVNEELSTYDPNTGCGELVCDTFTEDDTVVLTVTTVGGIKGSVTCIVGYNYYVNWDKVLVVSSPDKTQKADSSKNVTDYPLEFEYSVRPATCKIELSWEIGNDVYESKNLYLNTDDNITKGYNIEDKSTSNRRVYLITPVDEIVDSSGNYSVDKTTNIATGKIRFYSKDGQVNSENIHWVVTNPDDLDTSVVEYGDLKVKSFYTSIEFLPELDANGAIIKGSAWNGKYSRWDSKLHAFIIGDGEKLDWNWKCDKDYVTDVGITKIEFKGSSDSGISNNLNFYRWGKNYSSHKDQQCNRIRTVDGKVNQLYHQLDYGWTDLSAYTNGGQHTDITGYTQASSSPQIKSIAGLKKTDYDWRSAEYGQEYTGSLEYAQTMCYDDTVIYGALKAGDINITYFDYAQKQYANYTIKVYCEVRNNKGQTK